MIRVIRETHETPPDVRERVARAGGWNRFGEPNFRVVWGGSRLTWIGGKWVDRDRSGNIVREVIELRRVPAYLQENRWYVEGWLPPESYGSPEVWRIRTTELEDGIRYPALGPYPARGDYEYTFTLETAAGEFLPLTGTAVEYVVRAVRWARAQSRTASRQALLNREERKEQSASDRDDQILDLAFDEGRDRAMVAVP